MLTRSLILGRRSVTADADDARPLLDVLRGALGVRACNRGCDDGTCGACRVLLDGALVASCRVPWSDVHEGARVETYETLAAEPAAVRAVTAFEAERPTRCKLCVGALGVTAVAVAREGREGDADAVEASIEDATCMCTGRGSWRRALTR